VGSAHTNLLRAAFDATVSALERIFPPPGTRTCKWPEVKRLDRCRGVRCGLPALAWRSTPCTCWGEGVLTVWRVTV